MPDPLSPNLQHLKASETVAISNEAKRRKAAGEDVLDLGVGEPDFDTPAPAAQAGIQAIQKGLTRYPPNVGIPELRKAMAQNTEPDVGRPDRSTPTASSSAPAPSSRSSTPASRCSAPRTGC